MDKLIRPVFTLELNYKIVSGLVTVGKYDGTHPCLTAATTADKILIHSPHRRTTTTTGRVVWSEYNREIATLNINQTITALVTGKFLPNDDKDMLLIGTRTHLLAYHIHDNRDIFYKECLDTVKAIAIGHFADHKVPLVFVGGNSSVHAYDYMGTEIFWTSVGDVITALTLLDYNKDDLNELLVCSEDYNIKIYKAEKIIAELIETEIVTGLTSLPENRFAYAVSNGTVGVYEQDIRLWRVKSKNFAISIHSYDLLGKGFLQLVTGWSNGKIDCRSITTGEVLFKDTMHHGIAGIVEADYRSLGKADLICVSVEGEVRGYATTKSLTAPNESNLEQNIVRELLSQKQALLLELKHYEKNTKYNVEVSKQDDVDNVGMIPANTRLQIALSANNDKAKPHVEISLSTNNSTIIKAVIVFAEGIFKGETHVVHVPMSKLSSELNVPLLPPKDVPVDIHIKALVGYPNSVQYHVFELSRQLPRFSMYCLTETKIKPPDSCVEFHVHERIQRICMWVNQNFLLPMDLDVDNGPDMKLHLRCLRDDSTLLCVFEASGKSTIFTKNMSVAADLIQSFATFLNLESLESNAHFPEEEYKLKSLLENLQEIQDARLRLNTDIADQLGQVRTLIILAEDSRINAISDLPKCYDDLNKLNQDLIKGYNIRLANHKEGLDVMKSINVIIQKASRLRVGEKAIDMINSCRTAIKTNSIENLITTIRNGSS